MWNDGADNKSLGMDVSNVLNHVRIMAPHHTDIAICRRHLFLDLKPYVCLYEDCSFNQSPFDMKIEWEDHMRLDHEFSSSLNDIMTCSLCDHVLQGTGPERLRHLAEHLEEISLSILTTNAEDEESSDGEQQSDSSEVASPDEGEEADQNRTGDQKMAMPDQKLVESLQHSVPVSGPQWVTGVCRLCCSQVPY